MVGPGARKPSVGEGIESRRPLFCSGITTLHSLFIYFFFLSFIFTFASILVCVNNNNNNNNNCLLYYKLLDSVANSSEQVLVSEIRYMRGHSSLTKEASPEFATLCKTV